MIHGDMTFNEVVVCLLGAGLRIDRIYRQNGRYHARLLIEDAHRDPETTPEACVGMGFSIHEAIEDARLGLVQWQEYQKRRTP